MTDTPQPGQPRKKPGGRTGPQPDKAAALRRLRRLKQGTTAATVLGFGAMSWLVFPPARSTHTTAVAAAQPSHVVPTVTPTATSTIASAGREATTAAAPSANRAGNEAHEAATAIHETTAATIRATKAAGAATTATATAKASATATTAAPTATPVPPTATAAPATATPAPATSTPQSGFLTQGGQSNVGSANSSQAPVASSGAS